MAYNPNNPNGQATSANSAPVVIASDQSTLPTSVSSAAPANNVAVSGTLTSLSSVITFTLQSTASMDVDVSGSGFVGTIVVGENTPSGFRQLGLFSLNSSTIAPSITANGSYRVFGVPTSSTLSVQFSAYTSGSANVTIYGSSAPYFVQPYSANAANVLISSYNFDGTGNALVAYNSQLLTANVANTAISSGSLAVGTTAVPARVGSSNLANRKRMYISSASGTVYLGSSSSVTTTTGLPISAASGLVIFDFSANVTPYLIAGTATTVTILEAS